eukprot:6385793-Prymnesium_polylepis.1
MSARLRREYGEAFAPPPLASCDGAGGSEANSSAGRWGSRHSQQSDAASAAASQTGSPAASSVHSSVSSGGGPRTPTARVPVPPDGTPPSSRARSKLRRVRPGTGPSTPLSVHSVG